MLNWAARYYPILRILKSDGWLRSGTLLEIGSGPWGIGRFRNVPFVGCDLSFELEPEPPMFPIKASAAELPFADSTFDVVLASDVLEHIPPNLRTKVIAEALRVSKDLVIFGFPSGQPAWELDLELMEHYKTARQTTPVWLEEHMLAPFPGPDLFNGLEGWSVDRLGNENLKFHGWLMRREMSRIFVRLSSAFMRRAPRVVEFALKSVEFPPYYRQIFILHRQTTNANENLPSQLPKNKLTDLESESTQDINC